MRIVYTDVVRQPDHLSHIENYVSEIIHSVADG